MECVDLLQQLEEPPNELYNIKTCKTFHKLDLRKGNGDKYKELRFWMYLGWLADSQR